MSEEQVTMIGQINEFEKAFELYYNALFQFIDGAITKNPEYDLRHPELQELSIKLQVDFYKLPMEIQSRVLNAEFDVFLHFDNVIDFYNFRQFLIEDFRFQIISTIAERVDAELKLVKTFINEGIWNIYPSIIKRDYNFYRSYKSQSIFHKLENETTQQKNEELIIQNEQKDDLKIEPHDDFFERVKEIPKETNSSQGQSLGRFASAAIDIGLEILKKVIKSL